MSSERLGWGRSADPSGCKWLILIGFLCFWACSKDPQPANEIFSRLDHPDSDVRLEATQELTELWRQVASADPAELERTYLPVLEQALRTGGKEARFYGTVGLSLVGLQHGRDESLADRVAMALAEGAGDEDARIRQQVAEGLSSFQPRPPEVARAPLLVLLRDEDEAVVKAALGGIGRIRPQNDAVREALNDLAQEEGSALRALALRALGDLDGVDEAARGTLLEALVDDDREVRLGAIQALGKTRSASPAEIARLERIRVTDEDELLRDMAEATLYGLQDEPGVEREIWDALRSEDVAVRQRAARDLGLRRIENLEPALPALRQAMRDSDPVVRRYALKAVSNSVYVNEANRSTLGSIVSDLVDCLADEDKEARRAAVKAIGMIAPHPPRAVSAPVLALAEDPDPKVLELAFWVLARVRPTDVEVASEILETIRRRPEVLTYAARALGQLAAAEPSVVELLLDALNDTNREVRMAAMFGLSHSKSMEAEEPLRRIANDDEEDRLVRSNAKAALQVLLHPKPLIPPGVQVDPHEND